MTSAPVELPPSPAASIGTVVGLGPTAGVEAALAFAALVQQALTTAHEPGPDPAQASGTAEQEPDPECPEETPAMSGVQALLAALLAPKPVLAPLTVPATAPAQDLGPGLPGTADPALAQEPVTPVLPAGTPAPTPATDPTAPATSPATSPPTTPSAAPAAAQAAPTSALAATADAADAAATAAAPADPGTVQVVASGPVTVTGPGAAGTPVGDTAPGPAVAAQVIPEITRLVSDGEGVHRVTLQLNPKALGEVRVVLTMRHGEVHVRIAGGEEARNALASSSADLSRALHRLGIEEHRLTLTELPGQGLTPRGTGSDHLGDTRQLAHHPGGFDTDPHGPNSQHSWMGEETTATDGSSTSNPSDRSLVSARIQPVNLTRAAGEVDLRM